MYEKVEAALRLANEAAFKATESKDPFDKMMSSLATAKFGRVLFDEGRKPDSEPPPKNE